MEHSRILFSLTAVFAVFLAQFGFSDAYLNAQETSGGDEMALAVRANTVRVSAEWENGSTQSGFGFITGERAGRLYIATADHVVRDEYRGEPAVKLNVTFYSQQGVTHDAVLLQTRSKLRDLAVLRVDKPSGLKWRVDVAQKQQPTRLTKVWYVGRAQQWHVPTTPGRVNEIDLDDRIKADGLRVLVGTSGAPMFAAGGIVGMIVTDEPDGLVAATPIDYVARAFRKWGHPWQLSEPVLASAQPRTAAVSKSAIPSNPKGWYEYDGRSYMRSQDKLGWDEARRACRLWGADLAVVHSAAENAFLTELCFAPCRAAGNCDWLSDCWIGLQDRDREGDHRWVDGSSFDWQPDTPLIPNRDLNCFLLEGHYNNGVWEPDFCKSDNPVEGPKFYLCEKAR